MFLYTYNILEFSACLITSQTCGIHLKGIIDYWFRQDFKVKLC